MTRPDFTITADVARELAASAHVCGRPMLRRVHDRHTGAEEVVPIPCGSTRESVCPACARKGPDHPDAAVHRRLAPHRRTRTDQARPAGWHNSVTFTLTRYGGLFEDGLR